MTDERGDRFEGGQAVAEGEIESLEAVAQAIGAAVDQWRDLTAGLPLLAPLDPARAGIIILETVFDEILDAPSWRVLAAAFALACP